MHKTDSLNLISFAKYVNESADNNDDDNDDKIDANNLGDFLTRFIGSHEDKLCVMFIPNYFERKYADTLFENLKRITYNTDEESMVKIMGKSIKIPRKQVAFGDPIANYHFAGTSVRACDWCCEDDNINSRVGRELMNISKRVSKLTGRLQSEYYNYVLINNYADQTKNIGYHSDDERELGKYSSIVGISFGQEREIYFKSNVTGKVVKLSLPHNSLYVMFYPTNRYWKHSIPKKAGRMGQRISLTYRHIHTIRNI